MSAGFANGPVAQWAEELTRLTVEEGMDTYVYWPSEDPAAQLHRFAEEVAPAVREQVARERDRSQRRHR